MQFEYESNWNSNIYEYELADAGAGKEITHTSADASWGLYAGILFSMFIVHIAALHFI